MIEDTVANVDQGWVLSVVNQYWKVLSAISLAVFFFIKLHFRVKRLEESSLNHDARLDRILDRVDRVYLLLVTGRDKIDKE